MISMGALAGLCAWVLGTSPALEYDLPLDVRFPLSGELIEHHDDKAPPERRSSYSTRVNGKEVPLTSLSGLMKLVPALANEREAFEVARFVGEHAVAFSDFRCTPLQHDVNPTPSRGGLRVEVAPDRLEVDAYEGREAHRWSVDAHLFLVERAGRGQYRFTRPVACDDGKRLMLSTETYGAGAFRQTLSPLAGTPLELPRANAQIDRGSARLEAERARHPKARVDDVGFETQGHTLVFDPDQPEHLTMVSQSGTVEVKHFSELAPMVRVRSSAELFAFLDYLEGRPGLLGRQKCKALGTTAGSRASAEARAAREKEEGSPAEDSYRWEPARHLFEVHRRLDCPDGKGTTLWYAEETVTEKGDYTLKLVRPRPVRPRPAPR